MKKALLIEFNVSTGVRSGTINPRDSKLRCYGWQKLDADPALEIRLIEDDRDVSQYEDIRGVTLLEGEIAINAAIDSLELDQFLIDDEVLFKLSISQKGIDLTAYEEENTVNILKNLYGKKVLGIKKKSPRKV